MEFEIGAIFDGKVTGITKFGAFVALPGGRSGLVHISEVAYSYVNDVSEFLTVGQEVQVKVISVDENHRINLSIKQTLPRPERPARRSGGDRGSRPQNGEHHFDRNSRSQQGERSEHSQNDRSNRNFHRNESYNRPAAPKEPQSFEDMMKRYMSESERRQSELKRGNRISNRRSGRRSGGRNNNGGGNFYD